MGRIITLRCSWVHRCRSPMNTNLFTGDQQMFMGEQPPNYYKDY